METEKTSPARTRRRPPKKARAPQPEIQYTQPKPFFRNRLIVQLLSIAAVVLAVTVGISIFFKVDTVMVTGAVKHSALTITEASDIEAGDSLLFFGRAKAARKIKTALPYVDTVRFELKLPGTVNIIVQEKMVAYALQEENGTWWMMTADGMIAEQTDPVTAASRPTIQGVILTGPAVGEQAVAAEPRQGESTLTTTGADRLAAAVHILTRLENAEMFTQVTCLDVSDLFALRLYCGDEYRVELGDSGSMAEKLEIVRGALVKLSGRSGVLTLTYNDAQQDWEVIFQPWSQQ